jgi:hypothetical protein
MSLLVIALLLGTSIVASIVAARREQRQLMREPGKVLTEDHGAPRDPTSETA